MKAIIHAPDGPVALEVYNGRKGPPSDERTLRHYVFWQSSWYRVHAPGDKQIKKGYKPDVTTGYHFGYIEGARLPGTRLKVTITRLL